MTRDVDWLEVEKERSVIPMSKIEIEVLEKERSVIPMSQFIVRSSAACMPASCKYGPYRHVAVLEVEDGVSHVRMISPRARGVVRVVRVWERLYAGSSDRCAFAQAYRAAQQQADELNREQTSREVQS